MGNYNELVPRRERIPIHNKRIRLVVDRTIHIFSQRPAAGHRGYSEMDRSQQVRG